MRARAQAREQGFVLVGVVMFILVLTILGLSLFSLTNYEAQFMQHSMDTAESFQAAAGGLDRARFALAKTSKLSSVKDDLPLDGVVYAVARQGNDSTGTINWDDPNAPNVLIRVKAVKNGEMHFLEAMFDPSRAKSLYKRLMALSGVAPPGQAGLTVLRTDPNETTEDNWRATQLYGEIVQNEPDTSPIFPVNFQTPPDPTVQFGGVPDPDLDSYWIAHQGVPQPVVSGSNYTLDALGEPDSVKFFETPYLGGDCSLDLTQPTHFHVRGTAIWLLDRGIRSLRHVSVDGAGAPSDMLIIVTKQQVVDLPAHDLWPAQPNVGIVFLNSIDSGLPVILVSNAGVLIENRDYGSDTGGDDKVPSSVSCLSVFAPYAQVLGPDPDNDYTPSGPKMTLRHFDTDPANARIDRLSDLGLLPNTAAGLKGKLRFLAGTWREVDETNPP